MNKRLELRIAELSEAQQRLLMHKIAVLDKAATSGRSSPKQKQLVAYIVPKTGFNLQALKEHLKVHLPTYMIPDTVLLLDSIPQLPNGKIDTAALKETVIPINSELPDHLASSQEEKLLVEIWEDVLGFKPIRPTDNFFEIGGDSILSIQIIARARNEGLHLKPNDLMEYQTIKELAKLPGIAESTQDTSESMQGVVPLTPIQHWFFERGHKLPSYWNQIVEIRHNGLFSRELMEHVTFELIRHHEGLRLAFRLDKKQWKAQVTSLNNKAVFFHHILHPGNDTPTPEAEIFSLLQKHQKITDLQKGGLFRVLYLEFSGSQPNRIFLISHHLLVDAVSWEIIFSAINSVIEQYKKGQTVTLSAPKHSVKDWWAQAFKMANSAEVFSEFSFWNDQCRNLAPLPLDYESRSSIFTEKTIANVQVQLNKAQTGSLQQEANAAYNTTIEDLLLTALCQTITNWTGNDQMGLGLERMGRTLYDTDIDISGTTGWFTSFFPLSLNHGHGKFPESSIKAVKERLRSIPQDGIGYGLLRYLHRDEHVRAQLNQEPPIIFNYLGVQNSSKNYREFSLNFISEGARDAESIRTHAIEINAYIRDGKLNVEFGYSSRVFGLSTINKLSGNYIRNLDEIIRHCTHKKKPGYTPSDFPDAGLSQDELDNLMQNL